MDVSAIIDSQRYLLESKIDCEVVTTNQDYPDNSFFQSKVKAHRDFFEYFFWGFQNRFHVVGMKLKNFLANKQLNEINLLKKFYFYF